MLEFFLSGLHAPSSTARRTLRQIISIATLQRVAEPPAVDLVFHDGEADLCGPVGQRAWMPAVFRPSQDGESKNPGTNDWPDLLRRGWPFSLVPFLLGQQKK
ncbi:hypothetical protein V3391_00355 [Luteimonas sp. SMYT11W]|uniref:Uncharacterized protein n=1 Tax=Luteimonas flava TaxID=3115822 RepID=A0ABU7W9N0_9GAMM